MTSLILYMALGVAVIGLSFGWDRTYGKTDSGRDPPANNLWQRFALKVVVPLLAGVLIVAIWPIALFMQLKDMLAYRANWLLVNKKFAVGRRDLVQQMSIQEIEACERVRDPMSAVPDLPFGHLNAAWQRFIANLQPKDSIWTFSKEWEERSQKENRTGYVILRGKSIDCHFLTSCRHLEQG